MIATLVKSLLFLALVASLSGVHANYYRQEAGIPSSLKSEFSSLLNSDDPDESVQLANALISKYEDKIESRNTNNPYARMSTKHYLDRGKVEKYGTALTHAYFLKAKAHKDAGRYQSARDALDWVKLLRVTYPGPSESSFTRFEESL